MTAPAVLAWGAYKGASLALLEPAEGDTVLDVGCGTGEDARELARLYPGVAVVGVDRDPGRIAEAERLTLGLPRPVEFRAGDAHRLPFEAAAFDACRADKVFHHLDDPRRALGEMVRVARRGARIVVTDADYETLVVDGPAPDLGRRLATRHADRLPHGRIGRRLRGLFLDAGLTAIEVFPFTAVVTDYDEEVLKLAEKAREALDAGAVTAEEAAGWVAGLEAAHRAGRFFCALTLFTVRGRTP